jgi:filamentous hemagglutinin
MAGVGEGGVLGAEVKAAEGIAASRGGAFRGGRHGNVKGPVGDGLDSHHLIADDVSPFSRNDGPAIQMEPGDHKLTSSWGSGAEAEAFRAEQARLIGEGRIDDAMQMGIDDVTGRFPGKYDNAILEAIDALPE